MQELNEKLTAIQQEIIDGMEALESSKAVYEFKKSFMDNKTGKIGALMKEMKNIPPQDRAAYGKSVNVLKEWALAQFAELDEKMKVKVLNTGDGKISLSIKAVEEEREAEEMESLEAQEYSSDESVGTSLGDLFAKLNL